MRGWSRAVAVLLAATSVALALQGEQPRGGATHARPDTDTLAETLAEMGMTELLEQLVSEAPAGQSSADGQSLLAESKMSQAANARDPATRNKLLDEAVALLKQVVAATDKAKTAKDKVKNFRYRLRLAEASGLDRIELNAMKLMYLQGGPEDRQAVVGHTAEPLNQLEKATADVDEVLQKWRGDKSFKDYMAAGPELENLQKLMLYRLGWMRYYRGIALEASDKTAAQKRELLNSAIAALSKYARGEAAPGVKYKSAQVIASSHRELAAGSKDPKERESEFQKAMEFIKQAAVPEAEADVQVDAAFENARALIEWGKFDEVAKAVDEFIAVGRKLLPEPRQVQIDLKSCMLQNYLYEVRASREADAAKAQPYRLEAQKALMAFYNKYSDPGLRKAYSQLIAQKCGDRENWDDADSMIILAGATRKIASGDPKELGKAIQMLQLVIGRTDPGAEQVRPAALWQLAMALAQGRRTLEAGKLFMELARKYPDTPQAFDAGSNAVTCYYTLVGEREEQNQAIAQGLREGYVEALELLLNKWGADPRASRWYFNLGWQCERMADTAQEKDQAGWLAKSFGAYEKVPPAPIGEHMNAQYLALEMRLRRLREGGLDEAARKQEAQDLVNRLSAYAAKAQAEWKKAQTASAGSGADAAANKELAENIKAWGARSAMREIEVRYEDLGQEDVAKRLLDQLADAWPGTSAVKDGAVFRVRKQIERGETGPAIDEIRRIQDKFPQEAQPLMQEALQRILDRIESLSRDASKAGELQKYKDAYCDFAGKLYAALGPDAAPERVISAKRALAEAKALKGEIDEALNLYRECIAYDERQRQKQFESVAGELDARVAAINGAVTGPDLARLYETYKADLKRYSFTVEQTASALMIEAAMRGLESAEGGARKSAYATVVKRLRDAYSMLRDKLRKRLPVDANNIRGLARVYRAARKYPEALKNYDILISGIDKSQYVKAYWSMQLEKCQCVLEGYGKDPKVMANLVAGIRQLRQEDEKLGGLVGYFNDVEARAAQAAGPGH